MDKVESHVEFVGTYASAFRRHYQLNYYHTGRPYEAYEPAYCLGYELVTIHGLGTRAWDEVERKARRLWKKQGNDLPWEEIADAIEHGWNEAKEGVGLQDVDDYQEDFYSHYQNTYAATGHAYDNYEPAYRYGTALAYDERYMRRLWPEVEGEIRENWSAGHDTPWEDVSEAIQYAWSRGLGVQDDTWRELVTYDDDEFRAHHDTTFGPGRPYEYYESAYRFGYDLAYKRRYRGRPWEEIEPRVQLEWQRAGHDTPWEEIKGAIHHAWREVQKAFTLRER